MKNTLIEWADGTCNPAMACDGCELWPTLKKVLATLIRLFVRLTGRAEAEVRCLVQTTADCFASDPLKDVITKTVAEVGGAYATSAAQKRAIIKQAKSLLKCYAGVLTENRGGKVKG